MTKAKAKRATPPKSKAAPPRASSPKKKAEARPFFCHFPWPGGDDRRRWGHVTVSIFEVDGRYTMGFAFCSPNDAWDRRKGNLIAEGRRLRVRNFHAVATALQPNGDEPLVPYLREFLNRAQLTGGPTWARPRWMMAPIDRNWTVPE